jgi:hypothetical protein
MSALEGRVNEKSIAPDLLHTSISLCDLTVTVWSKLEHHSGSKSSDLKSSGAVQRTQNTVKQTPSPQWSRLETQCYCGVNTTVGQGPAGSEESTGDDPEDCGDRASLPLQVKSHWSRERVRRTCTLSACTLSLSACACTRKGVRRPIRPAGCHSRCRPRRCILKGCNARATFSRKGARSDTVRPVHCRSVRRRETQCTQS